MGSSNAEVLMTLSQQDFTMNGIPTRNVLILQTLMPHYHAMNAVVSSATPNSNIM